MDLQILRDFAARRGRRRRLVCMLAGKRGTTVGNVRRLASVRKHVDKYLPLALGRFYQEIETVPSSRGSLSECTSSDRSGYLGQQHEAKSRKNVAVADGMASTLVDIMKELMVHIGHNIFDKMTDVAADLAYANETRDGQSRLVKAISIR